MATTAETSQSAAGLEVDDALVGDNDSSYGDELSAFTTSITSSALQYRKENGRSYHAYRDGRYLIPNDETESDRLDIMHEMVSCALNRKLCLSPIGDSPRRALDLGTGTGIWAIEFADTFPSAEVIGNDLSPNQPTFVPPNLKFVVDDFEDDWAYQEPAFDFIHARYLAGSVRDFSRLLKQAYKHTKPGGWVEFQDYHNSPYSDDGTLENTAFKKYFTMLVDIFAKLGIEASPGLKLEGWFRDAGFVNVQVHRHKLPVGMWPKEKHYKTLGAWNLLQLESGLEAGALAVLTRHENWRPEEVKVFVAKALNDIKNPRIHGVVDMYVVCGQKPEE